VGIVSAALIGGVFSPSARPLRPVLASLFSAILHRRRAHIIAGRGSPLLNLFQQRLDNRRPLPMRGAPDNSRWMAVAAARGAKSKRRHHIFSWFSFQRI